MPKREFALEAGAPKRLAISWKGFWKNMEIRLDDEIVGTIADQKELREGRDFALSDGSTLHVRLSSSIGKAELQVLRDGTPLPGSDADPSQKVKVAYGVIYFLGGLNLVVGAIALLAHVEFLQQIGIGAASCLFGIVLIALGFMVRQGSLAALYAAIGIFAIDTVVAIYMSTTYGGRPTTGGIIPRIFLLLPMIQGVKALKQMRAERE
jgi:hypothetical protein